MARPRKKLDPDLVVALAKISCTYSEIAAVLNCSTDTLKRRYADLIEQGRQKGCASIRRKQFELALESRNPTMLIWLGKQYLGQKDHQLVSSVPSTYSIDDLLTDLEDAGPSATAPAPSALPNPVADPATEPSTLIAAIAVRRMNGNGTGHGP